MPPRFTPDSPTITDAIAKREQLALDIAGLLNAYTASTGLRITALDSTLSLGRGNEPPTYTVTVGVSL